MKNLVYFLGAGVLIYGAYLFITKKSALDSTENIITDPVINPVLQTQPQQRFPLQAVVPPRVDNADQPWYSGTRAFFGVANADMIVGQDMSGDVMDYNVDWSALESRYLN